jgi:lysophospholipase L1-like esterase
MAHVPAAQSPPPEVRILALGDSYTIGEGVAENDRWPERLAAMLRAKGIRVAAPTVVARTGWTTDELSAGIDAARPDSAWDLVTLLVGVNNQYRGRNEDEYRMQFRALLARAIAFARGAASHVIVVSIPDWGVTPFASGRDRAAISRAIDRFNTVNREEAARAGAHYADVTPLSRRAASDPSLVTNDGLHPSAAMYAAWLEVIFPLAARILA